MVDYLGEEKGKKRKIKGVGINGARRGRGESRWWLPRRMINGQCK